MEDKEFNNLQRRLRETRQLAEENHELLKKVYGMMWRSRLYRALYWVILIGIAVGAFYFLEPYFDGLMNTYEQLQGQVGSFPSFGGGS